MHGSPVSRFFCGLWFWRNRGPPIWSNMCSPGPRDVFGSRWWCGPPSGNATLDGNGEKLWASQVNAKAAKVSHSLTNISPTFSGTSFRWRWICTPAWFPYGRWPAKKMMSCKILVGPPMTWRNLFWLLPIAGDSPWIKHEMVHVFWNEAKHLEAKIGEFAWRGKAEKGQKYQIDLRCSAMGWSADLRVLAKKSRKKQDSRAMYMQFTPPSYRIHSQDVMPDLP